MSLFFARVYVCVCLCLFLQVMPEIYDILRHCEDSHLTADEKSLLATQLAPHWTNSEEARRALETAVVYTEAEEEAEFWQGLQASFFFFGHPSRGLLLHLYISHVVTVFIRSPSHCCEPQAWPATGGRAPVRS